MSSRYPSSWLPFHDTLLIKISTQNFQGIFLRVNKHHSWRQEWSCSPCLRSGTLNVLKVPPFLTPPLPETLQMKISTQNFQGIFLGPEYDYPWHQGWLCPSSLQSGTLNILQVEYKGPLLDTIPIKISTQNFQGIFLGIKKTWFIMSGLTLSSKSLLRNHQHPPSPPLLYKPSSWHTSNWDINIKFSGHLPWGEKTSFITSGTILSSMTPVRNPQCPQSTLLLDPLFLTHFQLRYQHQIFRVSSLG